MKEEKENRRGRRCPKCGNHCHEEALRCDKGRKYFDKESKKKDEKRARRQTGGLSRLLHRCGRFAHRAGLEDDALFQALTGEERAALQELLDKLSTGWQAQFGKDALKRKSKDHKK